MRIVIIGAGRTGLVAGACFADVGHDVVCVDEDARGEPAREAERSSRPEPGLAQLLRANARLGRLRFAGSGAEAINAAQVVFVAADAARDGERAAPTAAPAIAAVARHGLVVVAKGPGAAAAADALETGIGRLRPHLDFAVVADPHSPRAGDALSDFRNPARIVIGSDEPWASALVSSLYAPFAGPRISRTARALAERVEGDERRGTPHPAF